MSLRDVAEVHYPNQAFMVPPQTLGYRSPDDFEAEHETNLAA